MKTTSNTGKFLIAFVLLIFVDCGLFLNGQTLPISTNQQGKLYYTPDSLGNRVPDFSYCGYKGGSEKIPDVPIKVFVPWKKGDATKRIQKAINYLAGKPLDENGFRGTILLDKGTFNLDGRLTLSTSGIVIRGSGTGKDGTTLVAAGLDRETFIAVRGNKRQYQSTEIAISDSYVPVNSNTLNLEENLNLKMGDNIAIRRPVTKEWIYLLGMRELSNEKASWLGWHAGRNNIIWYRKITRIDGNKITFDAPLTTALDSAFGGAYVSKYAQNETLENVGIENLNLVSDFDRNNPKDENHCWMAITIDNADNCWVRQVNFSHFAGSAVMVLESARKITVEDCISENPVSEIAAQRRYTFFTEGQQTLFQRCYAEFGYHDFAVGNFAAGPNAFVQCESHLPTSFSGTIDRWASGVLFDLVNIDGQNLSLLNRETDAQGAGWTAANSMLWQCSASRIDCYAPPTANNWAYGTWGQFAGKGFWHQPNSHIKPRSLYYAQLSERIDDKSIKERAQFLPLEFGSTSSPTIEQAKEMTENARLPLPVLKDWITEAAQRNPIPIDTKNAFVIDKVVDAKTKILRLDNHIKLENGWLVDRNGVVCGKTMHIKWWRGNIRPHEVAKSTPHLTRYVPGKTGTGLTDNIDSVARFMYKNNFRAIDHHYGLWYERRRDDHQRIRRADGEVWPPFYEMPFSRSGQGTAWDGLSKYDLTKPNPWYWSRLRQFADQADQRGLLLIHQNYFQHNILEAGAHYADFPWRTANNINNPGLPEPVPYAGDKRIFLAEQFYDLSNEPLKALHKQYIWQCLENFKNNTNVIQLIGEEYTGPLHFVEFWLDVIAEWQETTGKDALVGLSTTKDVQDAILNDPKRAALIDIINIRYWQYSKDGTLFAPEGGKNLALRQFLRLERPKNANFESVYKAVAEYKSRYPDKAVIYSNDKDQESNWAVFMGGGSLAAIPSNIPGQLLASASSMKPIKSASTNTYILSNEQQEQIILCLDDKVSVDLINATGEFSGRWIDLKTGEFIDDKVPIESGKSHSLTAPKAEVALWIFKN